MPRGSRVRQAGQPPRTRSCQPRMHASGRGSVRDNQLTFRGRRVGILSGGARHGLGSPHHAVVLDHRRAQAVAAVVRSVPRRRQKQDGELRILEVRIISGRGMTRELLHVGGRRLWTYRRDRLHLRRHTRRGWVVVAGAITLRRRRRIRGGELVTLRVRSGERRSSLQQARRQARRQVLLRPHLLPCSCQAGGAAVIPLEGAHHRMVMGAR